MKFFKLIEDLFITTEASRVLDKDITGIATNHKKVKKGDVFIALRGENFDGNNYIKEAIANGASAVVSDRYNNMPQCICVRDAREAYAIMSKHFYEDACDKLKIVAVTGTNGKTTTCNTIADILRTNGKKVGVIGTLGAKVEDEIIDTGMTTPDPDKLHEIFKKMVDEGVEYVVMEASAHALALRKLDGITFEVGVLTNITEDHLDYFVNMDRYANAKFKLFERGRVKEALICQGKTYDEDLIKFLRVPCVTYGIDEGQEEKPMLCAKVLEKSFDGSEFVCDCQGDETLIKTPLVGQYNIENVLASIGVCHALGLSMEEIKKGVCCTLQVEGRFNVININGVNIVIDFAHTPDGLEKVLSTAKEINGGKLVVVFGCGGDRDRLKRPIMGEIASRIADEVILTSDNPRSENPYEIIADIRSGAQGDNVLAIENRKSAIEYVLNKYSNGETIVIAGKGAEKYQEINGEKIPYNDFDVVNEFYRELFLKRKKEMEDDLNEDETEGEFE